MIRRSTFILLVVFVVLLAGVLFWQRTKQSEDGKITPTAAQEYLFDLDAEITDLKIEGPGGKVVEVTRNDDRQWILIHPEDEVTDTARVETTTTQLLVLRVLANLEQDAPEKNVVGLDKPSHVITMTLDDGSIIVINIGNLTPTDSGYYVIVDGRGMFVIEKYGLQTILDLIDNPPVMPIPIAVETTPTP